MANTGYRGPLSGFAVPSTVPFEKVEGVQSAKDCAALCDASSNGCSSFSYRPVQKRCKYSIMNSTNTDSYTANRWFDLYIKHVECATTSTTSTTSETTTTTGTPTTTTTTATTKELPICASPVDLAVCDGGSITLCTHPQFAATCPIMCGACRLL